MQNPLFGNVAYIHVSAEASLACWQGGTCPLASESQDIFGNFKTLYQLRMCVMMSWDLNVYVRRKNIKLCPPMMPLCFSSYQW